MNANFKFFSELTCSNDSNELSEIPENVGDEESSSEAVVPPSAPTPTPSSSPGDFVLGGEVQEYANPGSGTIAPSGTSNVPVAVRPQPTRPAAPQRPSQPRIPNTTTRAIPLTSPQPIPITTNYRLTPPVYRGKNQLDDHIF